jgi:hypothetical protein
MFTLDRVVPWGRSFDEYQRMFALTEADLHSTILCCADGPASFNAEATSRGARVVSCDPLYRLEARQIRDRISATYWQVLDQTQRNTDEFVWDAIPSVEELGRVRMAAMEMFLNDYEGGKMQGPVYRCGTSGAAVPRSNVPAGALFAFPVSVHQSFG